MDLHSKTSATIPGEILKHLERMDCLMEGKALANAAGTAYYKVLTDFGGICLPYLVLVDGKKIYLPNEPVLPGLDASALAEYESIVAEARSNVNRSPATCQAVVLVADQFVLRLQNFMLFDLSMKNPRRPELRGMLDRARFCVYNIWKEGKAQ